jgi:hypothetical protein
MSFRLRKRNRRGGRRATPARDAGLSLRRADAMLRWGAPSRTASGPSMPRLGPLLLALIVVALLTYGLSVLFQ